MAPPSEVALFTYYETAQGVEPFGLYFFLSVYANFSWQGLYYDYFLPYLAAQCL